MNNSTYVKHHDIKQRHTCTHCAISEAPQDQQWCSACVDSFEQWLQRDYCEMCLTVTVDGKQTYCDACADLICLAMAIQWENIMVGEGLY